MTPTYTTPLATTPVITEAEELLKTFRYNFPSISTYTNFVGVISNTNIVNDTFALTEDANVISFPTEITGDLVVVGDLTANNVIVGSTNLVTEINTKQDLITTATDLDCNSLIKTNLEVNGGINLDTNTYFDTIVIRRPTGFSGDANFFLGLRELQCWVNNSNILFDNAIDLISNYALWTDKDTSLGGSTEKVYDNNFIASYDVIDTTDSSDIALIIKNIPLTAINTI